MAELLLELLSEEIPARMQQRGADDLQRLVKKSLGEHGLDFGNAMSFATPRRLVLVIDDLRQETAATENERKGPRVGAPEKALQGFVKAAGINTIDEAEIVTDPKKGDFYVVKTTTPARPAGDIISQIIPEVCENFPWPKSMRWGSGSFNWVRPLRSVLCISNGKTVPFEIAGIQSCNTTVGHRFHADKPFAVTSFKDYGTALKKNKVLLPASERAAMIAEDAEGLAKQHGLDLVHDEGLLNENAGLVEWPVVLIGTFDKEFLDVPEECLTTSMKAHQKCFSLKDPKTGKLANKFILVSNLIANDGGKEIIAGNEKVIRARLADAKFFWQQDLKHPLDEMASKLADITFHEKLGTQKDRVERIAELANEVAGAVDAAPDDARRAAQICKADLVSEMVGEFPELQGLMGRYYAQAGGIKPETARAIELHYKPKGPTDAVPLEEDGNQVAIAVALADKLDTLVGFWAIDEKPTGSGDPYQLRRAALGVIRILIENDLRLPLIPRLEDALGLIVETIAKTGKGGAVRSLVHWNDQKVSASSVDLLAFFADRLKVHLREEGKRHDLIDAVFALPNQDDLALIVKRVEALSAFLETDDGENLLAGTKRAANILKIEEKKDKTSFQGEPDTALFEQDEERALANAIAKVKSDTQKAIDVENFDGAMRALAELRPPVDAFFDNVTVNADQAATRKNRLKLLSEIRAATLTVADFSKIAG